MIDTHCHLYDQKLYNQLDEIVKNAKNNNIQKMICIGDRLSTSEQSIQIAEKYNNIYASVGIHPHEAKDASKQYLNELKNKAAHQKVVAIGEIGLDYHYNFSDSVSQKKIFSEQLELANELDLPTIVHCRNSDDDLYSCIKKSNSHKGVIHCFASNLDFAKKIIELGYLISFTGMVTFVKELEPVIKEIELSNMMIETDSPYLAPAPYRGKINQPAYVIEVAKKIAEIKKIELDEVIQETTHNAYSLFNKLNN
ncbi:TatD family hydrolase [bacterium]|nr:TatD family hydrolase [bacterium]